MGGALGEEWIVRFTTWIVRSTTCVLRSIDLFSSLAYYECLSQMRMKACNQPGIVPSSVEPVSLDMQTLISRISKFLISRISIFEFSGSWIQKRHDVSSYPGNKC